MPLSSSKQALRSGASAHVADILSGELFSPVVVSAGSRAVRSVGDVRRQGDYQARGEEERRRAGIWNGPHP